MIPLPIVLVSYLDLLSTAVPLVSQSLAAQLPVPSFEELAVTFLVAVVAASTSAAIVLTVVHFFLNRDPMRRRRRSQKSRRTRVRSKVAATGGLRVCPRRSTSRGSSTSDDMSRAVRPAPDRPAPDRRRKEGPEDSAD